MDYIKLFGYFLAAGVVFTSLAIALYGGRWQAVETAAYAGQRRPWWFILLSFLLIALYVLALIHFIGAEKNWASWILIVIIPVGWILKGVLLIFNPKGRKAVTSVEGDQNWRKLALARLPIAVILAVLAYYA